MTTEEVLIATPSPHINNPCAVATSNTAVSNPNFTLAGPDHQTRRSNRRSQNNNVNIAATMTDGQENQAEGDDVSNSGASKKTGKSRRELPAGAVATLKAWLLSPEHFTHPYPTPQDQIMLMQKTGIDKKQLKNWFTNARRRIWKPMLKKQLEQGKIQTSGGVVTMSGAAPGMMGAPATGADFGAAGGQVVDHTQQVMQANYQQALQQPQSAQQQSYDQYGNPTYMQQPQPPQPPQQQQPQQQQQMDQFNNSNYFPQGQGQTQGQFNQQDGIPQSSNSIGSLPPMAGAAPSPGSASNLNKTDSHAVLMELFARDQDLVRQATKERAAAAASGPQNGDQSHDGGSNVQNQLGSQHPMSNKIAGGSSTLNKLGSVPSMNSWPHFSSVSSLNNLGTMTGVKSITNMSGADLVSQGNLNRKGNLAQVKSIENFGRADSYAFLEVFFDHQGAASNQGQRGLKREREEDDNVGLSLDGDDASSPTVPVPRSAVDTTIKSSAPVAAPLPADGQDKEGLKRAYDDALAARGLISVSRSSEKLTDLALPAKMQRTISQEYLKSMNAGTSTTFTTFSFNSNPPPQPAPVAAPQPAPAPVVKPPNMTIHPALQAQQQQQFSTQNHSPSCQINQCTTVPRGNTNTGQSVEVPATTKCALCGKINVDTQLRPCGCMFHGKCLKPSMQNSLSAPQCPIDKTIMVSALLAVPTDENPPTSNGGVMYSAAPPALQESSNVPGL